MSDPAGPDRSAIIQALNRVEDPKSGQGLTRAGMVRGLTISGGRVAFMLEVAPQDIDRYRAVRDAAEEVLAHVPGVETAQVILTAETGANTPPPRIEDNQLSLF